MFNKLRTRITLLGVAVTTLVMLISFSAIYLIMSDRLQTEAYRKLRDMGHIGFSAYAANDAHDLSFMLSVDGGGKLIDAYSACNYPESLEAFSEAARFAWKNKSAGDYEYYGSYWKYQIYKDKDELYCIAFLEATNDRNTLMGLLVTLFLVGGGMLTVIFLFSRFLAERLVSPVSEAWEKQKRFVADASHELKTPLMTIMANCDVLEANEDETVKSQREWLDVIKLGAERMGRLINNLLILARAERTELAEQKRSFELNTLIGEVIQSMDASARAKELVVKVAEIPKLEIFGYADSIRQIFAVLYDNAVKYTNEGGVIEINIRLRKKQILLTARNTGEGISAEALPHIFDRFYRADPARTADSGSYGLGLAIARAAAERIGGQLTAKSALGEWTEFTFCVNAK